LDSCLWKKTFNFFYRRYHKILDKRC
jgi:hypothetical protein